MRSFGIAPAERCVLAFLDDGLDGLKRREPLFDIRLPPAKVVSVLAHVAEGVGTRKTARLTGVHPDTVTQDIRRAGDHARCLHDELVAFSPGDGRSAVR